MMVMMIFQVIPPDFPSTGSDMQPSADGASGCTCGDEGQVFSFSSWKAKSWSDWWAWGPYTITKSTRYPSKLIMATRWSTLKWSSQTVANLWVTSFNNLITFYHHWIYYKQLSMFVWFEHCVMFMLHLIKRRSCYCRQFSGQPMSTI